MAWMIGRSAWPFALSSYSTRGGRLGIALPTDDAQALEHVEPLREGARADARGTPARARRSDAGPRTGRGRSPRVHFEPMMSAVHATAHSRVVYRSHRAHRRMVAASAAAFRDGPLLRGKKSQVQGGGLCTQRPRPSSRRPPPRAARRGGTSAGHGRARRDRPAARARGFPGAARRRRGRWVDRARGERLLDGEPLLWPPRRRGRRASAGRRHGCLQRVELLDGGVEPLASSAPESARVRYA